MAFNIFLEQYALPRRSIVWWSYFICVFFTWFSHFLRPILNRFRPNVYLVHPRVSIYLTCQFGDFSISTDLAKPWSYSVTYKPHSANYIGDGDGKNTLWRAKFDSLKTWRWRLSLHGGDRFRLIKLRNVILEMI